MAEQKIAGPLAAAYDAFKAAIRDAAMLEDVEDAGWALQAVVSAERERMRRWISVLDTLAADAVLIGGGLELREDGDPITLSPGLESIELLRRADRAEGVPPMV